MACDRSRVSAYRDRLLTVEQTVDFEQHLAGCPVCHQTLAVYGQVGEAIRSLPVAAPPAELRRLVMSRRGDRLTHRPAWPGLAVGFVAAAMVLIVAGTVATLALPSRPTLQSNAATENAAPTLAAAEAMPTQAAAMSAPPSPSSTPPIAAPPTLTAEPPTSTVAPPPVPSAPAVLPATQTPAMPAPSTTATVVPPIPPPATPTTPLAAGPSPASGPAHLTPPPAPPTTRPTSPTIQPLSSATPVGIAAGGDQVPRNVVRAPLVTPTPGCPAPDERIGRTYSADAALRSRLGCPTGAPTGVAASEVGFQQGVMIRRADTRRVYVLAAGAWSTFVDGDPGRSAATLAPGEPAPPFLQAYRDHPSVRALLGAATTEPRSVQLTVQPFERGTVIAGDRRGLHVLYNDGRWEIVQER
ncbi:MAG: zf-HC2 domain-containing protein [Dehalococcoidia bacterium]